MTTKEEIRARLLALLDGIGKAARECGELQRLAHEDESLRRVEAALGDAIPHLEYIVEAVAPVIAKDLNTFDPGLRRMAFREWAERLDPEQVTKIEEMLEGSPLRGVLYCEREEE